MFHSDIIIKEGAFIVSDAHYSHLRPQFLEFIKAIDSKKLSPTQLIFMGDIFDALFGQVKYTHIQNQEIIDLVNKISLNIEIIMLEGNHDFNLKSIFLNAEVFQISQQPLFCKYNKKRVYLAHGDFNAGLEYKIYTALIRNPLLLSILAFVDNVGSHFILKKLDKQLGKKDDCKKLDNFESFISNRLLKKYKCDYFIEGHFHQNIAFNLKSFSYINLAAFACNQRYFTVNSSQDKELLEENIFSKGIKE